jgi:hypothetical protein
MPKLDIAPATIIVALTAWIYLLVLVGLAVAVDSRRCGPICGSVAIAAGAMTIVLTLRLRTGDRAHELAFRHVFAFFIVYLFSLFATYLIQKERRTLGFHERVGRPRGQTENWGWTRQHLTLGCKRRLDRRNKRRRTGHQHPPVSSS